MFECKAEGRSSWWGWNERIDRHDRSNRIGQERMGNQFKIQQRGREYSVNPRNHLVIRID